MGILKARRKISNGKNYIVFIKKSAEARNCALMAEHYKLSRALEKYPELRGIITSIQENKAVQLAVLFGSHARGAADRNSDIDIFVETKNREIKQELERLHSKLSVKIGSCDRSAPLIKEIEKNHVIIKGAELYYERMEVFQ